jgi:hypothetical protein
MSLMRRRGGLIVAVALIAAACGGSGSTVDSDATTSTAVDGSTVTTTSQPSDDPEPLRGFTLSPRSYESDDFAEFLDLVGANAHMLGWAGDAMALEQEDSPALVVHALGDQYGVMPLVVTGVSSTETGQLLRPLDQGTFEDYIAAAAAYAAEFQPSYLGYGVEIDSLYHAAPDDFDRFVDLFAAVAAAVGETSPETRLIVGFQLERMKGLNGGLFGGVNDESAALWELIDRFPDADIIGFSTYPGLVFEHPDDLPGDYYRSLSDRTDGRPVAFTEMGWHAEGDYGPYSGTDAAQARFVERFPTLIDGLDVVFYLWAFLFDQAVQEPFSSMGLIGADGTRRAAWDVWAGG